jgi:tetratricopeptide (TPR) repeat protein
MSLAALPTINLGDVRIVGTYAASAAEVQQPAVKLPGCKAPPAKRKLAALTQKFYKKVEPVDKLLNPEADEKTGKAAEPNYKGAWVELQKLLGRCDDCNAYESAQLFQRAGVIQYNLENVPKAIDYFKQVLSKAPEIPESLEATLAFQVAQLLTSIDKFDEALKMLDKWETLCPTVVPSDYFYTRAQNLYLMNRKDEALAQIDRAIKMVEAKGEAVREPWYKLKLAIYVDKEDYKGAEDVAELLVSKYFDLRMLSQLASLYGMNGKEKEQTALMDALYSAKELNSESQYKNLAYLYLGAEAPYLAAKVMKSGVEAKAVERSAKNLEVWAVSLTQAQEVKKALPIMEEAAQKAGDGKLYATLTAIYLDAEQFEDAVASGKKALSKGGLRSKGEIHMYIGSAYMNLERYDEALSALSNASGDPKYGAHAENLAKYVKREKERADELKKAKLKS